LPAPSIRIWTGHGGPTRSARHRQMTRSSLPPARPSRADHTRADCTRARASDHRRHQAHRELARELAALVESYAPQLLAERGCCPLTAAKLIGEIAGADRFRTDSKLARTGGSAPNPRLLGQHPRHRLDRGGNRQLNCALHRLAVNKANWDPHRRLPRPQASRRQIPQGSIAASDATSHAASGGCCDRQPGQNPHRPRPRSRAAQGTRHTQFSSGLSGTE
jgi:hypothetical protein